MTTDNQKSFEQITWEGDNQFEVEEFIGSDAVDFDDDLTFDIDGRQFIVGLGDTVLKYPDGRIMLQKGSGREGERHQN